MVNTGIDIIEIERLRKAIEKWGDRFLSRIFTKSEINYCNAKLNKFQHFAGKLASKEAVSKALKMKWQTGLDWREIEIINNRDGAAQALLGGEAENTAKKLKISEINISISHCKDYAVATAAITRG